MNMQKMMQEAQKLQKELQKSQKELESTIYTEKNDLVEVVMKGTKKIEQLKINLDLVIEKDDISMLEDMIIVAINRNIEKIDRDKEEKLGKYGQGLSGLM